MDNSTGTYQIWTSPINFTDIDYIDNQNDLSINLYPNFPNPFRSSTTISFGVKSESNVVISIMDNYGNEITIVDERYIPGKYELQISRKELNLGQGVYIIKMESEEIILTRKMLLIN